ncbi:MAG TPA: Lrp/AsnC family transcriptional regulator [Ginsengibacter sp.]|nr:Lrp/AsnC family transcriptional regulator [Ginsengibacter sp.]HRP18688.1 Lrp/AsnC family transcriptional regulator [Ginsengibacter sp.]HRP44094.1 Lrp/AsnC family transcriptional regulator [Ginsengibacter sp.]
MALSKEKSSQSRGGLDEKDLAILSILEKNARFTIKEIAEKVNLSTTPVHERIKRMEEAGIIKQYIALLDASKLNKSLTVICYVSLKEHGKKAGSHFINAIQNMPEVAECFSISGEFDFLLKVICEDMNSYYDFHVNTLSEIENVGHVQSVFVMGVIKDSHRLVY